MQSQRSKPRQLGSVRQNLTKLDRTTHLPRLSASTDGIYYDNKLDKHYSGIHGSAMAVPPTYVKTPSQSPQREFLEERQSSTKSTQSESKVYKLPEQATKKELREALIREKELKHNISELLKLIEELRAEIIVKTTSILELEEKLQNVENELKNALNAETEKHKATKIKLEVSNKNIEELKREILKIKSENENIAEKMQKEFEERLSSTVEEKDKEIKIRDDKLDRLKQHMAEALKGNSWERQQQLEELTKELTKIQDEADMLRMKIKSLAKNKGPCSHCEESNNKLQRAIQGVKERDATIKELKSLATKFETQLSQQDQILKLWADEKGHKYTKFPK